MHAIPHAPSPPRDRALRTMIKVSGKLAGDAEVAAWVARLVASRVAASPPPARHRNGILVVVGGGETVNAALRDAGLPESAGGQELEMHEQRLIAERELSGTRRTFERAVCRAFGGPCPAGVVFKSPAVGVPFPLVGTLSVPLSGDDMVRAVHGSFDEIFVITPESRGAAKRQRLSGLPRVTVATFPDPPAP